MEIYLVGGAVRDELLGLAVGEKDWVVVGATPQQLVDRGFKPVGRHFPVFLHPRSGEEYALARTERKTGPGYHGFEFNTNAGVTLEEDLKRRDLTINAMARDSAGQLVDPRGGCADLEARVLRHVSEAFAEDPVRVLRIARFAAKLHGHGFTIADGTLALMQQMTASGEVDHLVAERVWQEMEKVLSGPHPSVFFRVLAQAGALEPIVPELCCLAGREDAWRALDMAATQHPAESLFALLGCCTLHAGGAPQALCDRLRPPARWTRLALAAARLCADMARARTLTHDQLLDLLDAADAMRNRDRFEQLLTVCALCNGGMAVEDAARLRAALDTVATIDFKSALAGLDVRGAAAGMRVRELKRAAIREL